MQARAPTGAAYASPELNVPFVDRGDRSLDSPSAVANGKE